MSTNKSIIKTCIKIMILLLITISVSNVSYAATYTGISGVEQVVNADPSEMINKDIFLKYSDLKESNYLYCLEQGQKMKDTGSNYTILEYIEIDGEDATAMYNIGGNGWTHFQNSNEYNAIFALILNSDGQLGHGSSPTDAQKAVWTYFPYWIEKSGATLGTDNSWCSGSNWSAEFDGASAGKEYIDNAIQAYANGEKAKVRIYLLHNTNGLESWQRLMIAIPEGKESKPKDLVIDKIDASTQEKLGGVEFIIWNSENKFVQASGPDSNNIYTVTEFVNNGGSATTFRTGTTNGYKSITIVGLPDDTYTIRETYNPILGYEQNEGRQWQINKVDSEATTEYIKITATNEKEPPPPEGDRTTVIGKVTISGFVWEDIADIKDNTINSKYDSGETRLEGILVHWIDSNGTPIASTTTGEDGSYRFSETLELYNHPYEIKDKAKYERINNSYIEFDYNGIKYTTVANTSDLAKENVSQGKEIRDEREALDNKFDMIESDAIIDNGNVFDTVSNLNKVKDSNYLEKYAVTATTKQIINLLDIAREQEWTKKIKFCTEHCEAGIREHEVARFHFSEGNPEDEDYASATVIIYCNGKARVTDWNDINGVLTDRINAHMIEPIGNEFNQYNSHYYSAREIDGPTTQDCLKGENKIYEWNIQNVNLGLTRREEPDLAITSDIEKVRVIMKNQEYTYIYGNRGIQDSDESFDVKVQFGNKYLETYSRPVNPADIAYVNANNSDDLKVYVTYNIKAKNQSTTLYMTANNIVNYYDSNYTIYRGESSVTSDGWKESEETKNGYKVAYNDSLKNVKIAPQQTTEILKIEFEVNQDTIKGLINKEAPLKNVSEIVGYTTYYGENTRCSEDSTGLKREIVGKQYAGIDSDSVAGNAIPGDIDSYEDDTDQAPSFLLEKDKDEPDKELQYKIISGTVWEDSQTTDSANKGERLGDGVKSDTENTVTNVKVELLLAETKELAKLYKIKNGQPEAVDAVTYTDSNGNYSFGNNSTDEREGVVTNKYIIKYTYGNDTTVLLNGETKIVDNVINARNYKSTIITTSPVKEVMKGENNDKWHLTTVDNASVAVDDLTERLSIPSLKYENYDKPVNMIAYSKPFEMQVEYTVDQNSKVENDGGQFEHDWTIFDFGIIERPREDIVIDKTISNIRITLANGQILIDGDPRIDELEYTKAIGFEKAINNRTDWYASPLDKMLSMEIDSELLQGAKLDITYAITVTNNSEIDYEYESNNEYYYYGENPTNMIEQSVELVADYLDSELTCEVGRNAKNEENQKWGTVTADTLKDNGYISFKKNEEDEDKTYEILKNENYRILVTDQFKGLKPNGDSHTEYLSVSKQLAISEDGNVFDNHVEMLQLNGKIARTIDSTRNGEQIVKTYKSGNYIPTFANRIINVDGTLEMEGLHQLDDNRIRVTITPPTGTNEYITIYIITAVVGLIVMIGGIILIKKKVLNK